MSTTSQIEAWCRRHIGSRFRGAVAWDELPAKPRRPSVWVINMDPAAGTVLHKGIRKSVRDGVHWQMLALRAVDQTALFGDSYGYGVDSVTENAAVSTHDHVRRWLTVHSPAGVVHSRTRMQQWGSHVCGNYACYYALHGIPETNPGAFTWVSEDRDRNDRIIAQKVAL